MNNDILSKSHEMTNILASFDKLLDYIKVSDEAKGKKEELKLKILKEFNLEKLNEYLDETSFLLEYSINENQKIQEAFINGIKDNISTLFTTLTKTEGFRNSSTATDDSLIDLMTQELSTMNTSIKGKDLSNIEKSVALIGNAVISFKKEKEDQEIANKQYISQITNYAKKAELRLQHMQKILHQREEELIIDKLTGIYNRRGYEDHKNNFFSEFMKGNTMTLVVADIDDFKKINDTYGHQAGDSALAAIAKILNNKTGDSASVFRYGGEEFVIIYPYMPAKEALELTLNIQKYLTKNHFHNKKEEKIKLTLSFGFHTMKKGQTIDEAYEIADKRLYKAKANGKNQVVYN